MSTEHRDLRTERLLRFLECSSKWHRWLTPNQTLLNNPSSASLPNNQTLVNDQTLVNTPSFVNANPLPAPIEILPFVATPIDVPAMGSTFVNEKESRQAVQVLRDLFGDETLEFRCPEQENVLEYCLWTAVDIIAILPTGAGKSLAFFCYTKRFPERRSVVIVPTKSLRQDLKRRANDFGLSCCSSF